MDKHLARLIALVQALGYDISEDDRIIVQQELTDVLCSLPGGMVFSKEVKAELVWVFETLLQIPPDPDHCYNKSAEIAHALPTS